MSLRSNIVKPASTFKKNALRKMEIATTVNSILYNINSAIETANRENKSKISIRLPSSFSLPDGIDHSIFRLEVYYNIINIMENKDYKVKIISFDKNGNKIYKELGDNNMLSISWAVESDVNVLDMKEKLFKLNN